MPQTEERSVAELMRQATEQASQVVRDEMRLARAEMVEKGKRAGTGAGLFGGAGVVALYGAAALLTALVLGLAEGLPAWLAALLVAVLLFLVAGVLALVGRKSVQQAMPAVPEQTVESVKTTVDEVKGRAQR
jgi:Flp pilus assembly protein TadB